MDTASIRVYNRNFHINTNNTLFTLHIETMLAQFVKCFCSFSFKCKDYQNHELRLQ